MCVYGYECASIHGGRCAMHLHCSVSVVCIGFWPSILVSSLASRGCICVCVRSILSFIIWLINNILLFLVFTYFCFCFLSLQFMFSSVCICCYSCSFCFDFYYFMCNPVVTLFFEVLLCTFCLICDVLRGTFGMSWGGLGFSSAPFGVPWDPGTALFVFIGIWTSLSGTSCEHISLNNWYS